MPANDIVINATLLQIFVYSILGIFAIYLIIKLVPALSWRLITKRANECSLDRIIKIELAMAGEDPIHESVSAIRGIHTYKLFILYLRDKQVARAERMLQTAMNETQSVYVFRKAIDYYLSTGNNDQVKKIYETLLQLKRKSIRIRSKYASFLLSIEHYQEALIQYHICHYKYRRYNYYKNQIGFCYMQLGAYDTALTYFKNIIAFDDSSISPFYNAAECYMNLKDYTNAISVLNKVPIKMRDSGYYYYLSRILIAKGDYEEAASTIISAVSIMSEADIETAISTISLLFTEYSQKEMYAELTELSGSLVKAWEGSENYVEEDVEDEEDDGEDIIKRWRGFLEYWRVFGIVYSGGPESLSEAGHCLKKLNLEHPEDSGLLHLNAVYCRKSGLHREAVEYIKKASLLQKNEPSYFLCLSDCLSDIFDYTGSINALEEGIFFNHYELGLYFELAAKLSSTCDYDKAGAILERLNESCPDDTDILENLAFLYLYHSKLDEAEQYYDKLKSLAPDSEVLEPLEKEIARLKTPIRKSFAEFIKTTYYYLNEPGREAAEEFEAKPGVPSVEEVKSLFERVIQPQDPYSFMLTDQEYTNYQHMAKLNSVWSEYVKQDVVRIRIEHFTVRTYINFSDELYAISDTINKQLVLDLRLNSGGDLDSAIKIADMLTPKCKLATIYDRDGNILSDYESSDYQIKFKRIYILIDEETASASETLALILKKRLDNALILGKKSFGKDLGLQAFEIRELSCRLMISSNTMSIDGIPVSKDGILPDIEIENEDDWVEYVTKDTANA